MEKLNNKKYDYFIIANTYENPINDFIANEKIPDIIHGNIVFDLTLINGFKSNKYVIVQIMDSKIEISSIKPINDIDNEIVQISQQYFVNNSNIVKNNVLPNLLKYSILK